MLSCAEDLVGGTTWKTLDELPTAHWPDVLAEGICRTSAFTLDQQM